jgi:HEPN domain-containing protein
MIDDYIEKWIIKAVNDLKVAEHELRQPADEIVTDAICFHCQQGVEKQLKAYLASKNIDFGKTHNLEFLLERCLEIDHDFKEVDVGNLSFYAVEIRYPDEFYIPSIAEAKECFSIASKDKDFLLKKIS